MSVHGPNPFSEELFLHGVSNLRSNGVILGHDGDVIRLPGHSNAIETDRLN